MKTPRRLFPQLADFIKSHHTYDVPEITALPIVNGSNDYLAWIKAETVDGAQ